MQSYDNVYIKTHNDFVNIVETYCTFFVIEIFLILVCAFNEYVMSDNASFLKVYTIICLLLIYQYFARFVYRYY